MIVYRSRELGLSRALTARENEREVPLALDGIPKEILADELGRVG